MLEDTPSLRVVLTTVANVDDADRLGRSLVEEQLAACATLISGARSIYRWEGKIESTSETLLLLKTSAHRLDALELRLHELHSYRIPEFLVLGVDSVSQPYLQWILSSLFHD